MPDGVSSMFLSDLKHLPAPRNMKEEPTRMHWHETTQGYICNWGSSNQKRIKAEEKKKDQLRRSAPHRAWLNSPPDSRVVPPNIYLRPAELCDASWILDIVNWYVENSPSSEDTQLWNESDYEKLLDFCRNEKLPFVAAAQRTEVRHSKNQIDPVIGYAYVKYHRYSTNADSQMGELQVFVQKDRQRQHIGRALVDMVLSCYDDIPTKSEDYSFDQTGTVQYGAGYGRSLTTLVCSLAYPSEVQKRHSWLKEWLRKDFNFQEKGIFEGARVKFGARHVFSPHLHSGIFLLTRLFSFDICYMARQMDTPHMNEVSKTSLVRQLRWNFDEEDLIDLSSS
ncbi:Acyl-CoA N-acyltransferase [Penicillium soppii]|uniref:Acyl-CoA N-acyltransferase n=1 Tax=Penicillium soppii TaxID=69789 RepID=UPI002548A0AD|nr:Acyl-CoA N-acyltransferase [Penicillium soppii]KAJ5872698.1 Acyl-CoA N-acyltransferase [Penicillium soppii]